MIEDIQKVIRENLPSAVGEELKKVIEEYEALKKRLPGIESDFKLCKESALKLVEQNKELTAKNKDLRDREASVLEREKKLDVEILEIKLAEADKRADGISNLVSTIFRSPVTIQRITGSIPIPIDGGSAGSGWVSTGNIDKEIRTRQE